MKKREELTKLIFNQEVNNFTIKNKNFIKPKLNIKHAAAYRIKRYLF